MDTPASVTIVKTIVHPHHADLIDTSLNEIAKIPCESNTGERNCIDPQLAPKGGKRKGWHDLNPNKMCASCACYWHLSCARNFALGVRR